MTQALRGTGVALVTPFHKDHSIDWQGLERLLAHTAKGVDYYVVLGTTGESATLSKEEKQAILSFIKENNKAQLPIVYGLGGNDTKAILEQIDATDLSGVDAILSVSPCYNKPSQEGIFRHYTAIADKSPVPVILYNVPSRTSSNIAAETTLRLAKHDNIVGIKEASGNFEQCMTIAKNKPEDFLLISGDDLLTVPLMAIGGVGIISVMANALPEIFQGMVRYAEKRDFATASQYAFKILTMNPLMYVESNPVGVKCLLEELEVCQEWVRLPLVEASENLRAKIVQAYKELNLEAVKV